MKNLIFVSAVLSCMFLATAKASTLLTTPSYTVRSEIPFGGKGGWDYLNGDSTNHRLYLSHGDRIVIVDTETQKVLKEIIGLSGVHGFALVPALHKGYASNGKAGSVSVVDLQTLTVTNQIKVGEDPDAILADLKHSTVYAFNGRGKSASIIDAKSDIVVATLTFSGTPEFAAIDEKGNRIYVNIEDQNSLTEINTETQKVLSTWKLDGCEGPSGLAIDPAHHHAFSVCENKKMVLVDTQTGKTLSSALTGEGTDGAAYDPELGLAFSSNGRSGTLTVMRVEKNQTLKVVQDLKTAVGARTITLDPKTHLIYLPTASFEPAKSGARPKPIDGTQKVLVVGPRP
jgi:YVTN family beta-propeller protein